MRHVPASSSCPASSGDDEGRADFLAGQDPVEVAAAHWLVRRQEGLNAQEQAEYQHWLQQDEKHAQAIAELEEVWGDMDALPDDDVQALQSGLPQREERQPRGLPPEPQNLPTPDQRPVTADIGRPSSRTPPPRIRWLETLVLFIPRLAVLLFMVTMLGAGWLGWESWQRKPTFVQAFQTERGQQRTIDLPDGSRLWLDAASRAEVALYRQRREVVLPQGQALFSVQASTAQPFHVLAGPLRITVVGTQFSVRNDLVTAADGSTTGSVSVVVEQGRVHVARLDEKAEIATWPMKLDAGHAITTDAQGQITRQSTTATDAAPWRQGRVVFDGATLAQALAEFERYGNTHLVIRDPQVAVLRIHGSYSLHGLPSFASALPQVLPVRLIRGADGKTEIVMRR